MPSSTKRELKIVLDTNVWISAFLWGGKPAEIIKAAEHIVSGDRHLLNVGCYKITQIVSVKEFLKKIGADLTK